VVWLPGFKGWALELGETQNQKVDELLQKLKSLGERAKEARSSFGQPLADRLLDRLNKVTNRLPSGNGDSRSQQQPQSEVRRTCPKCGRSFNEDVNFCNCGFDFSAEARRQLKESFEREKLERNSRLGVITGG